MSWYALAGWGVVVAGTFAVCLFALLQANGPDEPQVYTRRDLRWDEDE